MIVTIGGNIGAGKTVLAEKLAKSLGYEELYMGGIFREMAAAKGISIEEFYAALRNDPKLEKETDQRQADLMRAKDNLVVQGRISWYFAQQSPFAIFNIFLKVDPSVGAMRAGQRPENAGKTTQELLSAAAERTTNEREHYRLLYGIENNQDPAHYDFILDTTQLTEEEVLQEVLAAIKTKKEP